ncbi:MAG: hypothetical protein OSA43_03225, partial [Pirellulales bacterium]|nr:hypothetical protein [Pirellulales bacterium]
MTKLLVDFHAGRSDRGTGCLRRFLSHLRGSVCRMLPGDRPRDNLVKDIFDFLAKSTGSREGMEEMIS